eukprot:763337-Hanusia_phi.AAC.3
MTCRQLQFAAASSSEEDDAAGLPEQNAGEMREEDDEDLLVRSIRSQDPVEVEELEHLALLLESGQERRRVRQRLELLSQAPLRLHGNGERQVAALEVGRGAGQAGRHERPCPLQVANQRQHQLLRVSLHLPRQELQGSPQLLHARLDSARAACPALQPPARHVSLLLALPPARHVTSRPQPLVGSPQLLQLFHVLLRQKLQVRCVLSCLPQLSLELLAILPRLSR